jgi:beta-ketoacyl-acyl-carrier-protein synthase II
MRRVVITGMGIVSPIGNSLDEVFESVVKARSGVGEISCLPTSILNIKVAAEVKGFDPLKYFKLKQVDILDRFSQFAIAAAADALSQSGFTPSDEQRDRVGVAIGTCFGGSMSLERAYQQFYGEQNTRVHPLTMPKAMYNAAAGQVSIYFQARGPVTAICTACSSGTQAIGQAYQMIKYGQADAMLAGGADAPITFGIVKAWESLRVLASGAGDPTRACRPFSLDREGLVIGEGAAVLVLEEYEAARARGAPIYAEIIGYGSSGDARHITDPNPDGPARAMKAALNEAKLNADEVGYINAHGTGTKHNDRVETQAIKMVFDDQARRIPISSTKSMHGHTMGAAGAIEFTIAVLALEKGVVPPTAHYTVPDPECDLDYVPNEAREQKLNVVLSNSFAFGGINAVLAARRV